MKNYTLDYPTQVEILEKKLYLLQQEYFKVVKERSSSVLLKERDLSEMVPHAAHPSLLLHVSPHSRRLPTNSKRARSMRRKAMAVNQQRTH